MIEEHAESSVSETQSIRRSAIFFPTSETGARSPTSYRARGAAHGGKLHQAAGATARVAADKRGVTGSQPQIHDSPRDQLNSRSIGDGEAHSSRQRE
jgi:hypothetical protein